MEEFITWIVPEFYLSEWMAISEKSRAGTQQDNRRWSRTAIALAGHHRPGAAVCEIAKRSEGGIDDEGPRESCGCSGSSIQAASKPRRERLSPLRWTRDDHGGKAGAHSGG